MSDQFRNFSKVTVSTGYNSSATSIVLSSGHGAKLPAVPFNAVWFDSAYADPSDDPNVEIVRVTAISTDTLTVTRGQESITATSKNTASHTYWLIAALTAKTLNSDVVTYDSNGNVGIGTTAVSKVHVHASSAPVLSLTDAVLGNGYGGALKGFGTGGVGGFVELGVLDAGTFTKGVKISQQGTAVGIFTGANSGANAERVHVDSSGHTTPGADNTQNFGSGSLRWSTIYAGTGTINTSDIRLKQDIREPAAAEVKVAKELKQLIKLYRFRDAVALKGDGARIHCGILAQEVLATFSKHGLDAHRYGLFCQDDDRYSIRYEELIMFLLSE